jgi:hypothetical protein
MGAAIGWLSILPFNASHLTSASTSDFQRIAAEFGAGLGGFAGCVYVIALWVWKLTGYEAKMDGLSERLPRLSLHASEAIGRCDGIASRIHRESTVWL